MIPNYKYYSQLIRLFFSFSKEINTALRNEMEDAKGKLFTLNLIVFDFENLLKEHYSETLENDVFPIKVTRKDKLFFQEKIGVVKVNFCLN